MYTYIFSCISEVDNIECDVDIEANSLDEAKEKASYLDFDSAWPIGMR